MFDSVKIMNECKKVLKKHNVKYCEDFKIFKKFGLIHCQVEDWRGPVEVTGFPILTTKKAVELLIESCAFSHYCKLEADNRQNLVEKFQLGYGEYDPRKFIFENILNVLKDYNQNVYKRYIEKYTKHINMNKKSQSDWFFNTETKEFETYISPKQFAVIIYKTTHYVDIYNQDPCGGRHYDNFYKLLSSDKAEDILTFTFTNNGKDRLCLDVYNADFCNESERYILIGKADKIVWMYNFNMDNHDKKRTRTFVMDGGSLIISEGFTE